MFLETRISSWEDRWLGPFVNISGVGDFSFAERSKK